MNRNWQSVISIFAVAAVAAAAGAHDGDHSHPPVKVQPAEVYKPSRIPDRIILTCTADPARTQAVTWRTSTEVGEGQAQIALSEDGPQFVAKAKTVTARSAVLVSNLGEAKYHSVVFDGLVPNEKYIYRVGDGVNWSEWFQFRTASDKAEPFSFIYFGDAQNDVRSMWSRVIREAHADAPRARFMIHAGDLINHANADAEWGEWHSAGAWLNGMVPSVPTPGNHEYASSKLPDGKTVRSLSAHWRPQFTLPENGPAGLQETVYRLDYQGVRIISLNSNEQQAEQVDWMHKELSDNPNKWTIVTFHHPIFSTGQSRDNSQLRNLWKPVFDKYRVDLVLTGHDHTYGRTGLEVPVALSENVPAGVNVQTKEAGTVYVVSVSGPKMYGVQPHKFMKRLAEDTQLYQIITVDGETLKYEARTARGELYDGFLLKKRSGQTNELIEQIPDKPERRRNGNLRLAN